MMSELFAMKNIAKLYTGNEAIVLICLMLAVFFPFLVIIRKLIFPGVNKVSQIRGNDYSNIFESYRVNSKILHIFTVFYIMFWEKLLESGNYLTKTFIKYADIALEVYIIYVVTTTINTFISVSVEMYKTKAVSRRLPLDLHSQILKILINLFAILAVFSLLFGLSISSLFTSLGAAAALLTFVFKDTVLGLLASLQLTYQDIIKVGDWVTLPNYKADGNIEKITITVIKIRNFDQTYTTVPTYAFLTTGVQNWRSMFEKGGRRIKRSISLDMDTISMLNKEQKQSLLEKKFIKNFAKEHQDLVGTEGVSNATLFRHYINFYLKMHQDIHNDGFTFLVRQLQPKETGLPIELYVFTKNTDWPIYEGIQADIFDHILSVMPEFKLKAFQTVIRRTIKN